MDEEQISTLRAALHTWIDQASVEQLERMNQVVSTDARRFSPVVAAPADGTETDPWNSETIERNEERRHKQQSARLIALMNKPPRTLPPPDKE